MTIVYTKLLEKLKEEGYTSYKIKCFVYESFLPYFL